MAAELPVDRARIRPDGYKQHIRVVNFALDEDQLVERLARLVHVIPQFPNLGVLRIVTSAAAAKRYAEGEESLTSVHVMKRSSDANKRHFANPIARRLHWEKKQNGAQMPKNMSVHVDVKAMPDEEFADGFKARYEAHTRPLADNPSDQELTSRYLERAAALHHEKGRLDRMMKRFSLVIEWLVSALECADVSAAIRRQNSLRTDARRKWLYQN